MGDRRWLPLWPLGLMVLDSAVLVAVSGTPSYEPIKSTTVLLLAVLGLVVTVRAGVERGISRRERRPWVFLAGYWVLSVGLQACFLIAFSGGSTQTPNRGLLLVGGIAWMLQPVPMLLCLLAFPSRRMTRPQRSRFVLDISVVCGGGFVVLWYLVSAPALSAGIDSSRVTSLFQPVLSLVLVFAVCAVMMRGGVVTPRHPLTFLLLGNVGMVAGSTYLGYVLARTSVATNLPIIDLIFQNAMLLMITAALMQRRGVGRGDFRTGAVSHRRPTTLPYVALGLGFVVLISAAVKDPNPWAGLIAGALVMAGAVAGRQVLTLRENHNLVVRDSLTGLSSRVAVYERLDRAVERSNRTGRPSAVLLIDLDGFKPINDRLGHQAGDELLAAFADVLRNSVRSGDTTGRLGGDEFVVILPDVTDTATAFRIAEKIVAACENPFEVKGERVSIGASVGVSITEAETPSEAQRLLHEADVAMFHVKRRRDDQHVILYDISMDLNPDSVPELTTLPGLNAAELAEFDRLRSRVSELEQKGTHRTGVSSGRQSAGSDAQAV